MGIDAKAGFSGLVTAVGEMSAQPGALRIADNVTLRKEGALVLRAFFASTGLPRAYRAAFPYKGTLYYIAASNALYGSGAQIGYSYNTSSFTSVTLYPPAVRDDIQAAKEARGNLYLASSAGAFKLLNAAPLLLPGARPTEATIAFSSTTVTGVNDLLLANQQVAYRSVMVRTDANGVVTRSRPSGAYLVATAGTGGSPTVGIYPVWRSTADFSEQKIELYRTRVFPTSAAVDDEMQLVATFVLGSMVVTPVLLSLNPIQYVDKVPDPSRTTTLYTSSSRGGIENANDRPPGSACIERFRGSLFFGNTVGPQRIVFSYTGGGSVTGSATGIGLRTATGTNAAGATTITSVSSTTGVRVGQIVVTQTSGGGGGLTSQARLVTAIAGSTVTVSTPLANAQTAQPVSFYDAITIDAHTFQLGHGGGGASSYVTTSGAISNSGQDVWTGYEVTPPVAGYTTTMVIEAVNRGGPAVQVKSSRGDEMSPAIVLSSAVGTGTLTTNDVLPHGLAWSEPDEPEHVPPKNFARVGDAGKAILALVATKDRLLIFKEDGLFMLTGDTAKNFAIYPLDTTALCILPGSVKRLQNTVYALTNLGLIAVDDSGSVQVVSRPVQNELAPIVTLIRQNQKASGLYNMPGLVGVTGTSDDANGEYWLMLGTTTPSFGGQMLVYNAFRQGFTTYSFGSPSPVAVAQDGEGQPLVLTATSQLTPSTGLGAITARVQPHAFSDPALVGKLWTHLVAGFSKLTGTTSVTARFSSGESMLDGASIDEVIPLPADAGLVQLPLGSLIKHPMPRAQARAFVTFVELVIAVASGTFTLELMGAEARDNIPNKLPSHGTGAT